MKKYIKHFSNEPNFKQDGLEGYTSELECKNLSITLENVYKGHEKYTMNTESYSIYYVIDGKGSFKIGAEIYDVEKNDIIEIPPKTKFVFKGEMKLLLIMNPPFDIKNDVEGEKNDIY